MRTCLDEFWNFIINDVVELIHCDDFKYTESIALEIVSKINCFFDFDKYEAGKNTDRLFNIDYEYIPEHITVFKQGLIDFVDNVKKGNKISFDSVLLYASQKADDCKLCYCCSECAAKFYKKSAFAHRRIPSELKEYFTSRQGMYYYEKEAHINDMTIDKNDCLICLKGLSSSSPMIRSAVFDTTCKGGGFYLNFSGIGIVVDPGIGFVEQFHKQGLYIDDINCVLISHNHLDHFADASVITSLRHDYKAYIKNRYSLYNQLFKHSKGEPENKNDFKWIVDEHSREILSNLVEDDELVCFNECVEKSYNINDGKIKVSAVQTEHDETILTYAMKIEFGDLNIGYTSDTKYNDNLLDFFRNCDLLIMNISDVYEKDVTGEKQKRGHLGFDGCFRLISALDAKAFVVSEFNCSNGDKRYEIVKELAERTKKRVVPAEVGLKINFKDKNNIMFTCSHCGNDNNIDHISVVSPEEQFNKIKYLCSNCYSNGGENKC